MIKLTPASISGCVLFLPHYPSSTTVSSGKASQTNDLSGSGHNFTQATGANQPTYQTSPPYGLANVGTTGIVIQNSDNLNLTTQTVGIKFKLDGTPASGIGQSQVNLLVAAAPSLYTEFTCLNVGGYQPYTFYCKIGGTSTATVGVNVALDTNTHRAIMTYNNGTNTSTSSYQFFLDGISQTIATSGISSQGGASSSLCSRNSTQSANNGKTYAVAVYNRVLSAAEISALDQILQAS